MDESHPSLNSPSVHPRTDGVSLFVLFAAGLALCGMVFCGVVFWLPEGESVGAINLPDFQPVAAPQPEVEPPGTFAADDLAAVPPVATPAESERRQPSVDLAERFGQALASGDPGRINQALHTVLPAWLALNPAAAMEYLCALKRTAQNETFLNQAVQLWGAIDPAAAWNWTARSAPPEDRTSLLAILSLKLAETNPGAALQRAESSGLAEADPSFIAGLVNQWAAMDAAATQNWVLAQPASRRRDDLVEQVALVRSRSAAADALVLVLDEVTPGPPQDEAVMAVLHQWATRDFQAATAWVNQLPASDRLAERAAAELRGIAEDR